MYGNLYINLEIKHFQFITFKKNMLPLNIDALVQHKEHKVRTKKNRNYCLFLFFNYKMSLDPGFCNL